MLTLLLSLNVCNVTISGVNISGHHFLTFHANFSLSPVSASCLSHHIGGGIATAKWALQMGESLGIHNPVSLASSHLYIPPKKTPYNTLNSQESPSCMDDTSQHLRKLFRHSTVTHNHYTTKTLLTGGFCPACLLAVTSVPTTVPYGNWT